MSEELISISPIEQLTSNKEGSIFIDDGDLMNYIKWYWMWHFIFWILLYLAGFLLDKIIQPARYKNKEKKDQLWLDLYAPA